jgi:DNA-binding winged helix-turn-helix (wHTH) protein/Tol biopolymer transport system component
MGESTGQELQFGDFTLDQARYRLQKGERLLRLEKLPMELLILLVQRRGELVSREEIAERLWGKDVFVDVDHSINTAIRKIRQALRDDPEKPRFVETVVGKGYRFAAPVISSNGDSDLQPQALPIPEQSASGEPVAERDVVVEVVSPYISKDPRPRWAWIAATATVVALAAALVAWWRMPPAVPVIESVTQLTNDGEPKIGTVVSDGERIYFNEGQTRSWKIAQVSVKGGPTTPVATRLVDPRLIALAPDGSALLAALGGIDAPVGPLWSIPLPAGEPRQLGGIEGQAADFFPDGRIVFSTVTALYIADSDGSNPRKLYSGSGEAYNPTVSPDGRRIAFGAATAGSWALAEVAPDGTDFRVLLQGPPGAKWSSDGKYLVYRIGAGLGSDLWALAMQTGLFHRSREPIRLTNGPLVYTSPRASRDGKQIFAIGNQERGELVRYDMKSHQFVPFLSGISAIDPTFSRDGQWVAYTSYPDHTLWRSRSDGSERMQLTYPPMEVAVPAMSPDGSKVSFAIANDGTYMVGMDGGQPQRIGEKNSFGGNWSPDGNLVVVPTIRPGDEPSKVYLRIFDFRTRKISDVPSSQGMDGGEWVTQGVLVAVTEDGLKLKTFDLKTQKWSDLLAGYFVSWAVTQDGKYLVFTIGGAEPKLQRLRFADHKVEILGSLKDFRRVVDSNEGTQISVAPDGSPVFTRDTGTQEIYALTVKWP